MRVQVSVAVDVPASGDVAQVERAVLAAGRRAMAAAMRAAGLPCGGAGARQDGIRVGTIHGAKGDEWRVVFVAGVEDGLLPHRRALEAEAAGSPTGPVSLAGELHTAYVAVTRPRERLYLTHCERREEPHPGGGVTSRPCRPSRFLAVLPTDSLPPAA